SGFDGGEIVEFQRQGVRDELRRHTRGAGVAERQQAGAGFDQQAVGVTVVAALEVDDLGAAGGAASQADGRHGGFGAGADEANFFQGRQAFDQGFGQLDFSAGGGAERQSAEGGFTHGLDDFGVRVAEDGGAPGADIVDVAG